MESPYPYENLDVSDPPKVRCEQCENIERFRVNEVASQILAPKTLMDQ